MARGLSKAKKPRRGPSGPRSSLAGRPGTNRMMRGKGPGKSHEKRMY